MYTNRFSWFPSILSTFIVHHGQHHCRLCHSSFFQNHLLMIRIKIEFQIDSRKILDAAFLVDTRHLTMLIIVT